MDPVTHVLTGAALSRAGLNRKTSLATATMVIGAEMPDIDVVLGFIGPVTSFIHHRGLTHTLLGLPLDAALTLLFVYCWYKLRIRMKRAPAVPPNWKLLFVYGIIGGLSHILLDYTNSYGVKPFFPFVRTWFSWDIMFVIEPLMFGALVIGLVAPWLAGLVSDEIGARRKGPRGQGWAIAALVFIVALWGFRHVQHGKAIDLLEARVYQGQEATRIAAYGYWLNPFKWRGVIETDEFYQSMAIDTLTADVESDHEALVRYKPAPSPAIDAARNSRLGRAWFEWAAFPVIEVEERGEGYMVRFYDLRFQFPERGGGRVLDAAVELDSDMNVVMEWMGDDPEEP